MEYEVVYEIPPMRGLFRTTINADSIKDAEEKIRLNQEMVNYRIKEIKELTSDLTDYQLGKLIHAFGLDYSKKPYRNYYQCPEDNDEWEDMCKRGYASKRIYGPREVVYFGTLKGLRKVYRENVTQKYFDKIND